MSGWWYPIRRCWSMPRDRCRLFLLDFDSFHPFLQGSKDSVIRDNEFFACSSVFTSLLNECPRIIKKLGVHQCMRQQVTSHRHWIINKLGVHQRMRQQVIEVVPIFFFDQSHQHIEMFTHCWMLMEKKKKKETTHEHPTPPPPPHTHTHTRHTHTHDTNK